MEGGDSNEGGRSRGEGGEGKGAGWGGDVEGGDSNEGGRSRGEGGEGKGAGWGGDVEGGDSNEGGRSRGEGGQGGEQGCRVGRVRVRVQGGKETWREVIAMREAGVEVRVGRVGRVRVQGDVEGGDSNEQ